MPRSVQRSSAEPDQWGLRGRNDVGSGSWRMPGDSVMTSPLVPRPRRGPSEQRLARYGWSATDPPRRAVLFINPRSGDGAASRARIAERARDRGIEVVILEPAQSLLECVDEAVRQGADALGMAGGDGSLAVVAAAAAAHGVPFICVPAGTRNHFALDLGVDRQDAAGALDAFTDGVERQIDLAEVNGRAFVNNVSLGIYGEAVHHPSYRAAKMRTLVETAERVGGPGARTPALRLVDDVGRQHAQLAIVLVSNNPYVLGPPVLGTRPSLDSGLLGIVILDAPDSRRHPPGRAWSAPDFEVFAPAPVQAGIDGEPVVLSAPLEFAIRPAALRVRISSRHPGASPSARIRPANPGSTSPAIRQAEWE
ncbi:diacylglycerol/lipid kinase family protein [Nocardia sp. NPDC059228]|uniref:diacylglycerol/lipid kinase family protein n=1 Tax=Nocardia sp. NPDC059228 TaxID=3346777 RepID=UPI0036932F3C